MAKPPSPSTLYRTAGWAVICLALAAALAYPQSTRRQVSKGPRAIGLLELTASGTARLVPVAIMVNGQFFDASVYKADPVPMALEGGTVYEAERAGNSVGLFTVTGVLQRNNKTYLGAGTWLPSGATPPTKGLKAETKPREDEDRPPVLRRAKTETPTPETKPAETKPTAPPSPPAASAAPPSPPPAEDTDRPRLRRGVLEPAPAEAPAKSSAKTKTAGPEPASTARSGLQVVPAISDAGGPEPRSFTYDMKPEEEQVFRKKMLAMAADELAKRARELSPEPAPTPRAGKAAAAAKKPQPSFEDLKVVVYDISSSNEPAIVLTAKAQLAPPPAKAAAAAVPPPDYYITLVTRSDLYGELHKLYSSVTDAKHLDIAPRMELIDAVDADGDGRAELLFRQTWEAGTSYVIYRVLGDQLWPLFQGTP